jgi:hypothetical protein
VGTVSEVSDSPAQLPRIDRLRHVSLEPYREHVTVAVEMPVPRDDDDRNSRGLRGVPFDLIQEPQTVFAGHRHVRHDDIGHPRLEDRERLTSRGGGLNVRTGMYQRGGEDLACVGIIIHDECDDAPEVRETGRITRSQGAPKVHYFLGSVEGK